MIAHPNRSRKAKATATTGGTAHNHDRDYSALLESVALNFRTMTTDAPALFRTDAPNLWPIYLNGLPPDQRQVHDCSACRRFIRRFGGLVRIIETGAVQSVMWPLITPPPYEAALDALRRTVERARVTGPFYCSDAVEWGQSITPPVYRHLAVTPPARLVFKPGALNTGQAMAKKRHDFETVMTALRAFNAQLLEQALTILRADALHRSEKFVGPVEWLLGLQPTGRRGPAWENAVMLAVATAPEGYCHPRASVVGSLLEDLDVGLPFDEVKRRFAAKTHPLAYQRPQAAPAVGAIKAAEALVEKMGIARSFDRRFARLDECVTIWRPSAPPAASTGAGVFSHLTPKSAPPPLARADLPPTVISWVKFARDVLPLASAMEVMIPHTGAFIGLTSAQHEDAPPIMRWDRHEWRNPVSWYVYAQGSRAAQWGLDAGAWDTITAVVPLPNLWGSNPQPQHGEGVVLVINGARDMGPGGGGTGPQSNVLFPEHMRPDLHGVRSVIEAHSKSARLGGYEEASACGLDLRKHAGQMHPGLLRVTLAGNVRAEYRIDRWE